MQKIIRRCSCGEIITQNATHCVFCNGKTRQKIDWPSVEILREEVWKYSRLEFAKILGISDNALKKYCQKNNIPLPNRAYSAFLSRGNIKECERIKQLILSHS